MLFADTLWAVGVSQYRFDGAAHHDPRLQDCQRSENNSCHPTLLLRSSGQEGQEQSADYCEANRQHDRKGRLRSCHRELFEIRGLPVPHCR